MSLVFGAATSDRVDGTNIGTDPTVFSILGWHYFTTLTAGRKWFEKGAGAAGYLQLGCANGVAHRCQLGVDYTTTDITATSQDFALVVNKWQFIAVTANATTSVPRMYIGSLTEQPAEVIYTTQTAGAGTRVTDIGVAYVLGNRATNANAIQGKISLFQFVNGAVLSPTDIFLYWERWQKHPKSVLTLELGDFQGTGTQIDLSGNGNHGTVTGATLGERVPQAFVSRNHTVPMRYFDQAAVTYNAAWGIAANSVFQPGAMAA